jgi:phage-related protein
MRKFILHSLILATLGVFALAGTGCESDAENAAEDVGEALEDAGENMKDAAENAGNSAKDAVENMGDAIEDATDK